jgi:hypothetical protein
MAIPSTSLTEASLLYVGYFNRAGDPAGLSAWTSALNNNTQTFFGIAGLFATAPEAKALYPYLAAPLVTDPTSFVNSVYLNLFNRSSATDPAGQAFWVNYLNANNGNPTAVGTFIATVIQSAVAGGTDNATLQNKATVAADFSTQTSSHNVPFDATAAAQSSAELKLVTSDPATVTAAEAATLAFVNKPPTFTLTQGIDSPTQGFSDGLGHTATVAGTTFNAPPFVVPGSGLANNTLNDSDDLETTGAAVGAATLNFTTTGGGIIGANPAFATNVTMNGINLLNISNNSVPAAIGGTVTGGFRGSITGLLVENNNNSVAPVQLGAVGQGLKTLMTNINITGFGGGNGGVLNAVILAAAAGDLTKTLNVSIAGSPIGATTAGGADKFIVGNDLGGGTAATPDVTYGTLSLTAATNSFLQLQNGGAPISSPVSGVDGLQTIILKGAGNVALGQDAIGNHQKLTTIDSSASTGNVFITGASAGNVTNAEGTGAGGANPAWLFGSAVGLLNDSVAGATFNLTSVVLGSGLTVIDASSATVANMAALKTGPGAGVALNLNDEIIVNSTVADTTLLTTFANIKGFTTLGVGGQAAAGNANGAGGTMNMTNLPGFSTIIYKTAAQTGAAGTNPALTITNQTTDLTVNVENNSTDGNSIKATATGGPAFTLVMGNLPQNAVDNLGRAVPIALNLIGETKVTVNALGGTSAGTDNLGFVQLNSFPIQENVFLTGDHNLTIGTAASGAIALVNNAGALETGIGMLVTDTDSGVVTLIGAPHNAAAALSFLNPADNVTGIIPQYGYSINAAQIDAHLSGGLIMQAGDSNFLPGGTSPATSQGNNIIGSNTAGNVLGGGLGNDTFSGLLADVKNTIYTDNGADKITLAAAHTAQDHIGLYVGVNTGILPGGVEIGNVSSITDIADAPRTGTWGFGTAQTPTGHAAGGVYAGLANGTGTSADMTVVSNFNVGTNAGNGDVLDFAAGAWSIFGPTVHGLVNGTMAIASATLGPAISQQINQAGPVNVAGNTLLAATDLVVYSTPELNANGLASALSNVANPMFFAAPLTAGENAHMLVAYSVAGAATPTVNVADVDFVGAGVTNSSSGEVHVSDIVSITGTSLPAFLLNANNAVHIVPTA